MDGLTQSVTVDRRARLLRFGALVAAAVMLSLSAFSTSARAAASHPTIVLVHGAFASPAGWGPVTDTLHKDGYRRRRRRSAWFRWRTTWRSCGRRWIRSPETRSWWDTPTAGS